MKKYFIIGCLSYFIICITVYAYPFIRSNYQYVLGTKYTCYYSNCYDLNSFYYDKKTKTYNINVIIDLMNWNQHEEYPSPYGNGYVTHLIFRTSMHNDKITAKCIGYVTGKIVPEYDKNGKMTSFRYHFFKAYEGVPSTIKDMHPLVENLETGIDKNIYNRKIKILANI